MPMAIAGILILYVAFGGISVFFKTVADAPNTLFGKIGGIISGLIKGLFASIGRIFKIITSSFKILGIVIVVVILYFMAKMLGWI